MKVDDTNQPAYERAGMRPFTPYPDRDEPAKSTYYAVPTAILECASDLASWARQSVAAAERNAVERTGKGRNEASRKARPFRGDRAAATSRSPSPDDLVAECSDGIFNGCWFDVATTAPGRSGRFRSGPSGPRDELRGPQDERCIREDDALA